MNSEQIDDRKKLIVQLALLGEYFEINEVVPYEELYKTLELITALSKAEEKRSITRISNLKVKHNCYDTLQVGYRMVFKEASYALKYPSVDNVVIIAGQIGILENLREYLKREKEIPLNILNEMDRRTVKYVGEGSKKFNKINHIIR